MSKLAQEEPGLVCEHLQSLGLLKGEDQDKLTLRQLFVDAVLADNCGISNFIQGSREELVGKAIEFQTRGFWGCSHKSVFKPPAYCHHGSDFKYYNSFPFIPL